MHTSNTSSAGRVTGASMTYLVVGLFFAWGFLTVLNDPLIAKLKGLFSLNYTEAMLTQFAFFLGYFIFSIPAGMVLSRLGYIRTIVLGLAVMAVGCLLFAPAAMAGLYSGFLAALFIVAAGITTLQVAANPYISVLGAPETASSRLTLAQAFNSFGTFIGPFVGAIFLLQNGVGTPSGDAATVQSARVAEAMTVLKPFLVIAAVLILLALVFWVRRRAPAPATGGSAGGFHFHLLKRPQLMLGVLSIFLYVGAEVSIGSGLTNYLMQDSVVGQEAGAFGESVSTLINEIFGTGFHFNVAQIAGAMVSIYCGLAMVGRFIGSYVLARVRPGRVLLLHALAAMVLAIISSQTFGAVAAVSVLVIGLANSIMFPTIFTLALEGLKEETPGGSSLLCMAIVGGALVPVAFGALADFGGLATALLLPAFCYLLIAGYGLFTSGALASHKTQVSKGDLA